MGGTFDPIHFGHLAVAEEARAELGLHRVLFIPAARQPLKTHQPHAEAAHRLAMVQHACASNHAFEPSPIEIDRGGPSYTVDTLAALHSDVAELYLLLGADAAAGLPRWRDAGRIGSLARIVIVARPGVAPAW
jgi:nicotinate-nucleotide adenylyltransferase